MFQKGDKISYPMHGAGVIEAVEECTVLEETKRYYVLRFSDGDIKVHVPVERAEKSGLRRVISADECRKVLESFTALDEAPECANWNRRNRENQERMKKGKVF
jgi:CarD family transcriptional regulator